MMKMITMIAIRTAVLVRPKPLASPTIHFWCSTKIVHNKATFAAGSLISIIITAHTIFVFLLILVIYYVPCRILPNA